MTTFPPSSGALDKNPISLNMLNPMGFRFQIKKLPNCNFYLQTVNIPEVGLPPVNQQNPFVNIPYPGDRLDYGTLDIEFQVDEDLMNWRELHAWIRGLGFPSELEEYGDLARKSVYSQEGVFSDASLIVTTNLKNPNIEFTFRDAFPISIGQLQLRTTDQTVSYITCSAKFKYTLYDVFVLP